MTSSAFRAVAPVSRFVRLSGHSRARTRRKPQNRTLRRCAGALQEYATQSGCVFHKSAVERILRNYAYTGNLLLQTKFRENHLTKVTRKNQGELPGIMLRTPTKPSFRRKPLMPSRRRSGGEK